MFSETVDNIVTRTGRADKLVDIVRYVRTTMRECQSMVYFEKDLTEDLVSCTTDPFIWTQPTNFRLLRALQFPDGTYPPMAPPGRRQEDLDQFYYAAQDYFVFYGISIQAQTIPQAVTGQPISLSSPINCNVAYHSYFPRLLYYASGARPAVYDDTTAAWTYLVNGVYVSTTGSTAGDLAARTLVSNWMIFTWNELIEEGGCTKLFNAVGDPRNTSSYSLYKSLQTSLKQGEEYVELDR